MPTLVRCARAAWLVVFFAVTASTLPAQDAPPFTPTAASVERPQPGIDVLGYAIDLRLTPPAVALEGREVITLVRQRGIVQLRLDAVGLTITRATVGGRAVSVQRLDSAVVVPLDAARGDTVSVGVEWTATPADGLVIRNDKDGWTAFGDNWPNRARLWLPVVDHPSDKATVSWTVRVPSGYRVIANGVSERVDTAALEVTWRFRHTQPIPTYLMVVGVGKLDEVSLGETACNAGGRRGCVPQSVIVAPSVRAVMPGTFSQAGEIVRFFSSLVGPFPYDRLAHVQSRTRFGGMENAGAIFYAWEIFGNGQPFPPGLIAHETAHQWFGDAVTERAWAHAWLSEGFATYLAAMYAEHVGGSSALEAELAGMRKAVMNSAASRERPVIDTAQTVLMRLLNTNSYQKGGHVLHMLRREVGDSAFVRGMRIYQAEHRNGNALTADFADAIRRTSGRDMGWFFAQWLTRPGWAELAIVWREDAGGLVLDVAQVGAHGAYRLSLPLAITLADGREVERIVAVPADAHATLKVPLGAGMVARAVRADVHGDLLAKQGVKPAEAR